MMRAAASSSARCENALGELAEVPARVGVELLRVEAERRRLAQQPLHEIAGALELTDGGERRDEPNEQIRNVPSVALEAVAGLVGAVAQHESLLGRLVGDASTRVRAPPAGRKPNTLASSADAPRASVS
jgi:hypothetical protein